MPIEIIEKMFCCKNLKDTLKCIILQSCQGNKIGNSFYKKKKIDSDKN